MAEPKILSYKERGIKLDGITKGVPINIFVKKGIPFSVLIEPDTTYLDKKPKLEYQAKDAEFVKKTILKDIKFLELIDALKANFFSTESKMYCFYDEGKLYVYDIMTNTNHFPFCDIIKISKTYKYEVHGLYPMVPIYYGYKDSEEVIEFLFDYFKKNPEIKIGDLFIMPSFPALSSTTYVFMDTIENGDGFEAKEEEFILPSYEFVPTVTTPVVVPGVPLDYTEKKTTQDVTDVDDIEFLEAYENDFDERQEQLDVILGELEQESLDEKKKKISFPMTNLSQKDIAYTICNLRECIELYSIRLNINEERLIEPLAKLWAVWQSLAYMSTVQKFIKSEYGREGVMSPELAKILQDKPSATLSFIFKTLWEINEKEFMETIPFIDHEYFTTPFIAKILQNEFYFYIQSLTAHFPKDYYV